jgi:hypothetical protein
VIALRAMSAPSNVAAYLRAVLALASVLRVSAVSPAAHPVTSPGRRAVAGSVETTDSDRRRSFGSEDGGVPPPPRRLNQAASRVRGAIVIRFSPLCGAVS